MSKLKLSFMTSLALALLNNDIELSEYQDCLLINDVKIFYDEYYGLLQEAYISTHPDTDDDCYVASSICLTGLNAGKRCNLYWDIKLDEHQQSLECDESNMCDWSNPSDVRFG
jgi:hypothetical protein